MAIPLPFWAGKSLHNLLGISDSVGLFLSAHTKYFLQNFSVQWGRGVFSFEFSLEMKGTS